VAGDAEGDGELVHDAAADADDLVLDALSEPGQLSNR
jgi:hypothetical protein